ncbi:kinase-like domain-containing protein [Gigaspora rosea]|uniref:Kinase-like domain-containing protein n=1 Tax=Gigaspora rosea TaxID=44941 RepID=A0A397UN09_9GLOM|nr:kinase-like domain-containing protein [Gigaspora rosea]
MKHIKDKCVNCGKNRKLKPNKLCTCCDSKQTKCISCNRKVKLYYENNKLCTDCYHARQILNINSGNQDIDNLIKATHSKRITYRLEWIQFTDFVDIKQIGSGGFSEVFTATWTKGTLIGSGKVNRKKNVTVVLKVFKDSSNINSAFLKELQNIVESQPNSSGRKLVRCYGVSLHRNTNNYIFVMSYMSHGSLNEYLSNDFKNITWQLKIKFLRDIVTGTKWIHENKIIHRDIHGGNILINIYNSGYSESFVADLGFSRPAKEDPKNSEIYGIMSYIAPEVFRKKQYSFSSDIYSLGMIMWELTSGHRPFCDRAYDVGLMLNICSGLRPEIAEDTPQCWAILMQKCWNSEPLERPSISEIYSEINSKYWDVRKIFIEADNKRQELFKSGNSLLNIYILILKHIANY